MSTRELTEWYRNIYTDRVTWLTVSAGHSTEFFSTNDGSISFFLEERGRARLSIVDARGRTVRTLYERDSPHGRYSLGWEGTDNAGHRVAPGVYFAILQSPGRTDMRKIVVGD